VRDRRRRAAAVGRVRGFFFDQDGVIIDTERDGHLVAFNRAFERFGLAARWDIQRYMELLQIAGGKERIRRFFPDMDEDFITRLHRRKTDILLQMLESGSLPLRSGVRRLMEEVNGAGLVLGVCTTSDQRVARTIAATSLKGIHLDFVLAGDVVTRKKPDPEIYTLALQRSGLQADECIAIEDSKIGVEAAKNAGLFVVATPNEFTEREDLGAADVVVTSLGDPEAPGQLLRGSLDRLEPTSRRYDGVLRVDQLVAFFSS
jgi:HAD superfamily hydrolase (TIGR01509 family)